MANSSSSCIIPIIDLSPFFNEGDEDGKKKAIEVISQACSEYGFFQIVNHGLPLDLMTKALELSKEFFQCPDEEKHKYIPDPGTPLPAGYNRQAAHSPDKHEYFLVYPPGSTFNIYPQNPPEFREVLEDVFTRLVKIGSLIEDILNEGLGLPPNFLKEFNHDRSWDFMTALHYYPATENENLGHVGHEDANSVTLVFQDETGGLEVLKNGEWVPVTPTQGTMVVNVSDVIQVLSNNKFRSATHRVVSPKGKNRYSYALFYNLQGDKWVEPLPQFTKDIGEPPKYRGFFLSEYLQLKLENKLHITKPEDAIRITHYAITS